MTSTDLPWARVEDPFDCAALPLAERCTYPRITAEPDDAVMEAKTRSINWFNRPNERSDGHMGFRVLWLSCIGARAVISANPTGKRNSGNGIDPCHSRLPVAVEWAEACGQRRKSRPLVLRAGGPVEMVRAVLVASGTGDRTQHPGSRIVARVPQLAAERVVLLERFATRRARYPKCRGGAHESHGEHEHRKHIVVLWDESP